MTGPISARLTARLTALTASLLLTAGCTASGQAEVPTTGEAEAATTGSEVASTAAPVTDSAAAQALAVVPAGIDAFTIVDHERRAQRWGLPDISSADVPDSPAWDEWVSRSIRATGGTLDPYVVKMAQDWGWSSLDVRWEVQLTSEGPPSSVIALDENLDMNVVLESLAGQERSGPGDRPTFRLSPATADFLPFFVATVLPDRHLVVLGEPDEELLALAAGDGNPTTTDPAVTALLDAVGPADWVSVTTGVGACTDPMTLNPRATPEQTEERFEEFAALELAPLTASAVAVVDDEIGTIVTGYADDATAAADLPRRTALWTDGSSAVTGQPYPQIATLDDAVAVGSTIEYTVSSPERGPIVLTSMWAQRDTPWAFC